MLGGISLGTLRSKASNRGRRQGFAEFAEKNLEAELGLSTPGSSPSQRYRLRGAEDLRKEEFMQSGTGDFVKNFMFALLLTLGGSMPLAAQNSRRDRGVGPVGVVYGQTALLTVQAI